MFPWEPIDSLERVPQLIWSLLGCKKGQQEHSCVSLVRNSVKVTLQPSKASRSRMSDFHPKIILFELVRDWECCRQAHGFNLPKRGCSGVRTLSKCICETVPSPKYRQLTSNSKFRATAKRSPQKQNNILCRRRIYSG